MVNLTHFRVIQQQLTLSTTNQLNLVYWYE